MHLPSAPPHLVYVMLGIKPRVSHIRGNHVPTSVTSQARPMAFSLFCDSLLPSSWTKLALAHVVYCTDSLMLSRGHDLCSEGERAGTEGFPAGCRVTTMVTLSYGLHACSSYTLSSVKIAEALCIVTGGTLQTHLAPE